MHCGLIIYFYWSQQLFSNVYSILDLRNISQYGSIEIGQHLFR